MTTEAAFSKTLKNQLDVTLKILHDVPKIEDNIAIAFGSNNLHNVYTESLENV